VSPYNYNGSGMYDKLVMTGFEKANSPQSYIKASCSNNPGTCHGTQSEIGRSVSPYNYNGSGMYDKLVMTGFEKANSPQSYIKASCSNNPGTCHGTQSGNYEQ